MSEISRFLGISIRMYYRDHSPPHFHAEYGEYEVVVHLKTLVVEGKFPPRALRLVCEWTELHESELLDNWELARAEKPLNRILPLE